MTMTAKTAFCWPGLRSMVTVRYLSRRIGRSQSGRGGCLRLPSSWRGWPRPCRSAGGAGVGLGLVPDRCRGPAAGQPLDGQAGPWAGPWRPDPPPLIGGAWDDVPRALVPPAADRPAPRDQPEAAPAAPAAPLKPLAPLEPLEP